MRWGWLALYTLHPARPSTYAVCELCVGKKGQFPGHGTPEGKDKEPVPTYPTPPQPPSSREAVIIIFCHLFGKLQVLLLSFTPFLGKEMG